MGPANNAEEEKKGEGAAAAAVAVRKPVKFDLKTTVPVKVDKKAKAVCSVVVVCLSFYCRPRVQNPVLSITSWNSNATACPMAGLFKLY